MVMAFYSQERKAALLKMMLPPLSLTAAEVSRREGCSDTSLHLWRSQAANRGAKVTETSKPAESWSAEAKLMVIIESSALSELELNEYCRRKGIFVEQISAWRRAFVASDSKPPAIKQTTAAEARQDKLRIRELERELRRKDAALAETAALLVLRKKLNAYWGSDDEGS
jgi:transposase-like protein